MRLADLNRVKVIEEQVFPVPWPISAYEYEITQNRLADYLVLTVQQGDQPERVIGYTGYWLLVDEAHISTIAVDPDWQGRGLGELLLQAILNRALEANARIATLEVRRSNIIAQALYTKYDFEIVGERRRYYQGKEDALIMTVERFGNSYQKFLRDHERELFVRLMSDLNLTNP